MTMTADELERMFTKTFLSRVPEVMARGGFTIETAIEQAYQEDLVLIARLSEAAHSHGDRNAYREAIELMSDEVYSKLRIEGK